MFYFNEDELKIRCPARILVVGPSGSGKSEIVQEIITHRKQMLDIQPTRIIYFYDVLHPQIKSFAEKNGPIIELVQGFNPEIYLDNNPKNHIFIVVDDLMSFKNIYEHMSNIWTKYSRHLSISCCFLTQNLYHKGDPSANKFSRDLIINSSHKILFKSITDKYTALSIGKGLGNYTFFKEAYESICKEPHGYILLDHHFYTKPMFHYRTHIFFFKEPVILFLEKLKDN